MSRIAEPEFTYTELQILWHLKNNGGSIVKGPSASGKGKYSRDSLIGTLAGAINVKLPVVKYCLRNLEQRCIILRTYMKDKPATLRGGYNVCLKIELLDPDMYLPPIHEKPLAVVVAQENEELYERTAVPEHEISAEDIVEALLRRVQVLQDQVNKLQDIIEDQAKQLLHEREEKHQRRSFRDPVMTRVRDVLPPEEWDKLRHPKKGK